MAKKDDIDWDDPDAVAAARGDNPDDAGEDERNPHRTEEEQAAIDAKAEEDKKADKDAKAAAKKADEDKAAEDAKAAKDADAKAEDDANAKADADDKGDKDDKDDKDDKANKKEAMIPKSRLDAKNRQNKALQDRIDTFERDKATDARTAKNDDTRTVIEGELTGLDKAINQAISDDKMDEAADLRKQVRDKERELWQMDMDESSTEATSEAREQVRLDLAIDHIETTYDEFNPDSEGYSQETVDKVQELRNGFVATGKYTATQALLRAMDYVLPKKAVADLADATDPAAQLKKEDELRKAGLKKATDAANKQPADAKGTGDDADSAGIKDGINVDELSYEDIASLPEATLKRMRGDIPA
jgi:hypothetical protein